MKSVRSHLAAHGIAWLDLLIALAGIVLLLWLGLFKEAILLEKKWMELALSQATAHLIVAVRRFDLRCETALRIGLALAVALAG